MRIGDLLGQRYRLDDYVDGGAMGEVWKATDTRLNRTVAVKVLHASLSGSRAFRRRLEAEARAAAALRAPGVVNVYDFGEDDIAEGGSVSYLVMEFVDGRALSTILADRGKLPPGDVMAIMAKVALALEAAHRGGVIHRDVKPGNILITESNEVKVVDFGIARAHGESGLTSTGQVMGTVAYVSPEQLYDEELTGTSDIYSLGVVGYECLAGHKPFAAEAPAAVIRAQLHETPPALPDSIPAEVRDVVMRCLAKEPGDRWPNGAAVAKICRRLAARLPQGDSTEPMSVDGIDDDDATVRLAAPGRSAVSNTRSMPAASSDEGNGTADQESSGGRGRKKLLGVIAAAVLILVAVTAAAFGTWPAGGVDEPGASADETTSTKSSSSSSSTSTSQEEEYIPSSSEFDETSEEPSSSSSPTEDPTSSDSDEDPTDPTSSDSDEDPTDPTSGDEEDTDGDGVGQG